MDVLLELDGLRGERPRALSFVDVARMNRARGAAARQARPDDLSRTKARRAAFLSSGDVSKGLSKDLGGHEP